MLLVPTVALASDTSLLPEKEPIVEVMPFGADPETQTTEERLHDSGLHKHPSEGESEPQRLILKEKKKQDRRFQLYHPSEDKRVGLKIKIRLWSFTPGSDGVTKRFYVKPKISAEPRLMFTFKF